MLTALASLLTAARTVITAPLRLFNTRTYETELDSKGRVTRETPVAWTAKFWRRADGGPIFGPIGEVSGENAWISRQGTRHRLRHLHFQFISKREPLWPRRARRSWARDEAGLEYLRMMKDTTNMVPNERELLAPEAV